MKKIVSLFFTAFISLFLVTTVSAADFDFDMSDAEIIYQDEEITVGSFGNDPEIARQIQEQADAEETENPMIITPFSSSTGPGGTARIVAANSGRALYWSVKPATGWPWVFNGTVKLRYHSGFKRDAWITGGGALGMSASGIVTMNKNNGGYATLTGSAFSVDGRKYSVLPDVGTSFRPN